MVKEIRLDIANTRYREGSIVTLSTHRQLFDGAPSVGNCFVGELNAELKIQSRSIPKNAKFVPYIRDDETNVWVKKSEFFVYSRKVDWLTGHLKIVAYDALFRSEAPYIKRGGSIGRWPRKDIDVVQEIATRIGVTVAQRTVDKMTKQYDVQFPGITLADGTKESDENSMRTILGWIGSMYGGNWMINNNGELDLVIFGDVPTAYLVTENHEIIVMGGVRILVR